MALVALLAVAGKETEIYSSVALNDDFSFYARLVLLLSALVMLGLAHEEPADDRAPEFFGSLLMTSAGAMLVASANELAFLFVGLELVSIPHLHVALPLETQRINSGGGYQVFSF